MDPNVRLQRAGSAAWREIDGQAAIISMDVHRIRLLNEVGTFIWGRCDGRSLEQIVADVCRTFAVDEAIARGDVERFVEDLVGRGMLVLQRQEADGRS